MSQRETREFISPGGRKVVLNAYLTGREAREIKEALFASLKMDISEVQAGKVNMGSIPASILVEQEHKAISFLLVSIDGQTNNALETLLDLPSPEYDAVVAEVNATTNPTKPGK